jgi:hypothetical protein
VTRSQAERIFWVGFAFGLFFGICIGVSFGIWVAA